MTFKKQGFLSIESEEWIKKCRLKHDSYFRLAAKANQIAVSFISRIEIDNTNLQEILCAALFARISGLFEASIILIERCMINESKIMLRAMLNATFTIGAISRHEDVMLEYIEDDDVNHRLYLLNTIKRNPHLFKTELSKGGEELINKKYKDVKHRKNTEKPSRVTVKYLAVKADMKDFYNTTYSLFSSTEHSSARDMEQYLKIGPGCKLKGLEWPPAIKDIGLLLLTATETLTYAFGALDIVFRLSDDRITEVKNVTKQLFENLPDENQDENQG